MRYLPMLCKKGNTDLLHERGHLFEPKLDGTRCIAEIDDEVNLFNRRGKNIKRRYPEICRDLERYRGFVFDGEIICYNERGVPDFYLLQKREHIDSDFLVELRAKMFPATYVIFDVLEMKGKSLIDLPIEERKKILSENITRSKHIDIIFFTNDGERLWNEIVKRGMEGVIAKRKESKYYPGQRRSEWLKIKNLKSADVVIVGYTHEKREISSLGMALYDGPDLIYVGKVGTGFDEAIAEKLLKDFKIVNEAPVRNVEDAPPNMIWIKPNIVVEVEYLEVTKRMELRGAVFRRLRSDKSPEECTIDQVL
mgnify:CR=1 FL=1